MGLNSDEASRIVRVQQEKGKIVMVVIIAVEMSHVCGVLSQPLQRKEPLFAE
jgi:hypothetical protein